MVKCGNCIHGRVLILSGGWVKTHLTPLRQIANSRLQPRMPEHTMTHALLVIDVQNDFCPGGALAVPQGDTIVAGINNLMSDVAAVILTQDWHPAGHSSFATSHNAAPMSMIDMPYGPQVLWPDHCIQGSEGAAFHPALNTTRADMIIRKGFNPEIDSYSAFFENDHATPTGLTGYLHTRGITRLTLVGLATDFCVNYSAVDAAKLGFEVTVRMDLCRAIDFDGSLEAAVAGMTGAGVAVT
jgi:nicotinamidase/pyrazinamidase